MSFDWFEYLKLAQELAGQPSVSNKDARLRSSVSRAYYASFCIARNYLRDREGLKIPSGAQAHLYVRNRFLNRGDKLGKAIGNCLHDLRTRRNQVDYDDAVTGLPSMANVALKFAASIVSAVGGV